MENLQADITMEILSRLPVNSVLECVKIQYRQQLDARDDDRRYVDDYISLGYIFLIKKQHQMSLFGYPEKLQLQYNENIDNIRIVDYQSNEELIADNKEWWIPNNMLSSYRYSLVGSCNGLVCFSRECYNEPGGYVDVEDTVYYDPVFICNPITRERINLPSYNAEKRSRIVSGFSYHASKDEYKVVRIIYHPEEEPDIGYVQVYTVGDGNGWRNKEEISYCLWPSASSGILMSGALVWIDENFNIVAFDLSNEVFCLLPQPPCYVQIGRRKEYYPELREFKNSVCVVSRNVLNNNELGNNVEIWLLKGNVSDMTNQNQNKRYWTNIFSTPREGLFLSGDHDEVSPLALTNGGEILFWNNVKRTIFRFDPNTATTRVIVGDFKGLENTRAITHMNTFVTLMDLGRSYRFQREGDIDEVNYLPEEKSDRVLGKRKWESEDYSR
ncbi:F-box protein At3g07870-like [Papaver somniferum]|uniref:F-box protein At3g07870-like n=1 Tax=Papaver somniferum TaxID=3469 RepID=UPI000E6FB652|nr:F-box protein At3g07870-like [Papaver somniferum]